MSTKSVAGLEGAHVISVSAFPEHEALLRDTAKARNGMTGAAGPGRLGADLATAAGWEALGMDFAAGLTLVYDDRVKGRFGPHPVVLAKVSSRDLLIAALAKLGPVSLGATVGPTQELLVEGQVQGYLGALGERTAVVFSAEAEARAGFEQFLSGNGKELASDTAFERATSGLASGPGVVTYSSIQGAAPFLATGLFRRREREMVQLLLTQRIVAGAVRVGDTGFGARVLVPEATATALREAFEPSASPPPLAKLVPGKGWVAARASVNLALGIDGLSGALAGPGIGKPGMLEAELSRAGFSWSEISAALDGHFGYALDLGAATMALTRSELASVNWLGVLGVADGDKADALVTKLVTLARMNDDDLTRTDTRIGDEAVIGLTHRYGYSLYVMRHGKMLLVAPSIATLTAALAPTGPTLADSDVGEVLGGSGFFVVAGELSPLVTLAELRLTDADDLLGLLRTERWQTMRAAPSMSLEVIADRDGILVKGVDASLSYGLVVAGLARLLAEASSPDLELRARRPAAEGGEGGELPPTCAKYVATMRRCFEQAPPDARKAADDAFAQTIQAWKDAARSEEGARALDTGCKSAWDAARGGMGAMCPDVSWE